MLLRFRKLALKGTTNGKGRWYREARGRIIDMVDLVLWIGYCGLQFVIEFLLK